MSDKVEGIVAASLVLILVLFFVSMAAKITEDTIATSCELSGSFVVLDKAYKCEEIQ
tara:strand:- start:635 stop:805 length:171 start_codon:yes stop_codon:yes gene_type:complete